MMMTSMSQARPSDHEISWTGFQIGIGTNSTLVEDPETLGPRNRETRQHLSSNGKRTLKSLPRAKWTHCFKKDHQRGKHHRLRAFKLFSQNFFLLIIRDEDFWNPKHDVIEYVPPSPKIPKIIDYGHSQEQGSSSSAQKPSSSSFGFRDPSSSSWNRDPDAPSRDPKAPPRDSFRDNFQRSEDCQSRDRERPISSWDSLHRTGNLNQGRRSPLRSTDDRFYNAGRDSWDERRGYQDDHREFRDDRSRGLRDNDRSSFRGVDSGSGWGGDREFRGDNDRERRNRDEHRRDVDNRRDSFSGKHTYKQVASLLTIPMPSHRFPNLSFTWLCFGFRRCSLPKSPIKHCTRPRETC